MKKEEGEKMAKEFVVAVIVVIEGTLSNCQTTWEE